MGFLHSLIVVLVGLVFLAQDIQGHFWGGPGWYRPRFGYGFGPRFGPGFGPYYGPVYGPPLPPPPPLFFG
uniref:SFRICE_020433 n=1 Tax=Spodoptera frugiperda TaxID=7108 RepID=A0A2H1VX27_SPOFR